MRCMAIASIVVIEDGNEQSGYRICNTEDPERDKFIDAKIGSVIKNLNNGIEIQNIGIYDGKAKIIPGIKMPGIIVGEVGGKNEDNIVHESIIAIAREQGEVIIYNGRDLYRIREEIGEDVGNCISKKPYGFLRKVDGGSVELDYTLRHSEEEEKNRARVAKNQVFGRLRGTKNRKIQFKGRDITVIAQKEYEKTELRVGKKIGGVDIKGFKGNNSIEKVIMEEGNIYIGAEAFRRCSELREVDLSKAGRIYIGSRAFVGCGKLKVVRFPDNIGNVDDTAFRVCKSLKVAYVKGYDESLEKALPYGIQIERR